MKKTTFQTSILAGTIIAGALLAVAGMGFKAPTGEMSKLAYEGNLWCISNYVEEEDAEGNKVTLPEPDGRNSMDSRYKDKEDWFRREQVTAENKEEAEQKATKEGFFEKSDKHEIRAALERSDEKFVTHHFNTGATHPGPCVGTGGAIRGLWINDAMRQECFDLEPPAVIPEDNIEQQTDTKPADNSTSAKLGGICIGGNGVPENWAKVFSAAGKKFNVNPAWIATIFAAERGLAYGKTRITISPASKWPSMNGPFPTSHAGAKGPMQIMDNTWPGCKYDGNGDGVKDRQNVYDAIFSGARLISQRTGNMSAKNPTEAMMRRSAISYNCGPNCKTIPPETIAYIKKTREAFKRYNCP